MGAGIVQTFPGPWIEPVVLAGLGLALILAGGRKAAQASRSGADAGGASLDAAERAAR